MRYLTMSADYLEPSLGDERLGSLDVHQAGLSKDLTARILAWNRDYQTVIPLDHDGRKIVADLIEHLDAQGMQLARDVEREMAPAKVRYYSEGLLRER